MWLSPARKRPTVTISIHEDVVRDETAYYQSAEKIFRSYGGRPHWGKVHYLNADELSREYERWVDWWNIRNELDPTGTLLNEDLKKLRSP